MARRGLMPEPAPEPEDEGNVSPEEQAQYDQFVAQGMKLYNDPKVMPSILGMIEGDGDPVNGLASATATIVVRLVQSMKGLPTKMSGDVIYHGGVELLEQLADVGAVTKLHDFTPEEMQQAELRAVDMVRDMLTKSGDIDNEAVMQDFNALVEADKAGNIDEVLPGISEAPAEGEGEEVEPEGEQDSPEEDAAETPDEEEEEVP